MKIIAENKTVAEAVELLMIDPEKRVALTGREMFGKKWGIYIFNDVICRAYYSSGVFFKPNRAYEFTIDELRLPCFTIYEQE